MAMMAGMSAAATAITATAALMMMMTKRCLSLSLPSVDMRLFRNLVENFLLLLLAG